MQCGPLLAIRPPVLQHEVFSLLDHRRGAVPVKRMLHHDAVVIEQSLLVSHIDVQIRVVLIQVVERHSVE